jgi:hypothetical protein
MFEITCDPRQCDPSCRAKDRKPKLAYDSDGTEVLVVGHDTHKSGGYYGAWWQSWPVPAAKVQA